MTQQNQLAELHQHSIKHHDKITKPYNSLLKTLNISYFSYQRITNDKHYYCIANTLDYLEFYFDNSFYSLDPYLSTKENYLIGQTLVPIISVNNPEPLSAIDILIQKCRDNFKIYHSLLLINRSFNYHEIFCFGADNDNIQNAQKIFMQIQFFNQFIQSFKKHLRNFLNDSNDFSIDITELKGKNFNTQLISDGVFNYNQQIELISNISPETYGLYQGLMKLTKREFDCLSWLVRGKTASETAALMNISARTVEIYRDNAKQKLGGYSNITYLAYILGKYHII